MSKWVIALATVTMASAGASTYLWQELRQEREQTTTLQTRIAQLERAREPVAPPPPPPESEPAEEPVDRAAPAPAAPAPKARLGVASGAGAVPYLRTDAMDPDVRRRMMQAHEQQVRMLQDPEYRELIRSQHKFGMQRQYADLELLLGLSKEQAEQLIDVLAEQSVRSMEQRPMLAESNESPPTEAQMRERQASFEELRRKNESEIAAVLGSRYGEWQQYQQNGWARSQVMSLRQSLSSGNEPLRQDQIKPLVEAIAREQKQLFASRGQLGVAPQTRPDPMTQVRHSEEWLERTAQSHERIRAAVSGLLTPSQYEQLERQQEQALKMQELSVRQQRARVEAQARGELPPDPPNAFGSIVSHPN